MPAFRFLLVVAFLVSVIHRGTAQPYFQATAELSGNNILYKIKAVDGNITCGWSDIELFMRNSTSLPDANDAFLNATITVNTNDFPGVSFPYNGMNVQGSETGYNNYWFGISFGSTTPKTYNQNVEYIVCTIMLPSSPAGFEFELCHNEPNFSPHYLVLTDEGGNDWTSPASLGINKYYGPGAYICEPDNCPVNNPGNNHILPLNGPTPVELLAFQAKKYDEHTALLNWNTANEINFSVFEIERESGTGWEKIAQEPAKAVPGTGASYQYFDRNPPARQEYYRLKMVDFDGSFAYSPIRQVSFAPTPDLLLSPNPATDILYIQVNSSIPESELLVELYSFTGKKVLSQQLSITPGIKQPLSLLPYSLPSGVYFFWAISPSGFTFYKQVVLQAQN